jgi:arylsulfatase A
MLADPAQERNLAEEEPETLSELSQAYDVWFEDVTREGFAPIPITIGYPGRKSLVLPGHEAFLHPEVGRGISYHRRAGYANDWIDNWKDLTAYPFWEVEVARPGSYEASLLYVCSARDVGSKVAVEVAGERVEAAVEYVHDPEPLPSPDYVPRGEVYEKEWATLKVGRLELPAGPTRLRVRALSIPGKEVLELKGVIVDGPL